MKVYRIEIRAGSMPDYKKDKCYYVKAESVDKALRKVRESLECNWLYIYISLAGDRFIE